jgi:hypothetical protein
MFEAVKGLLRRDSSDAVLITRSSALDAEYESVKVPQQIRNAIDTMVKREMETGHFRDAPGADRFPSIHATDLSDTDAVVYRDDMLEREIQRLLYASRGAIQETQILRIISRHSSDSLNCWQALKEANRVLESIAEYEKKRTFGPDERKEVQEAISSIGTIESLLLLNKIRRMRGDHEIPSFMSFAGVNALSTLEAKGKKIKPRSEWIPGIDAPDDS